MLETQEGANDDASQDRKHNHSTAVSRVPLEALAIVAKHLVASDLYGTCAALNATCSAIHRETLPTLYKTVVIWAARVFDILPGGFWENETELRARGLGSSQATVFIDNVWTALRSSSGAEWIEYLAYDPYFCATLSARHAVAERKSDVSRLELSIILSLTENYQYGSDDLLNMSSALRQLLRVGGAAVSTAVSSCKSLTVFSPPAGEAIRARSVDEIISTRNSSNRLRCEFCPVFFHLLATPGSDRLNLAQTVLEVADWIERRRNRDMQQPHIDVYRCSEDDVIACLNAFQRAVRADYHLVVIPLRFMIDVTLPLNKVWAFLNDTVAIARDTFLRTRDQVSLEEIGVFNLELRVGRWALFAAVGAVVEENVLGSVVMINKRPRILHRDPWVVTEDGVDITSLTMSS